HDRGQQGRSGVALQALRLCSRAPTREVSDIAAAGGRNDMMTSVHPDKLPSGVLEKLSRANHGLTARYPGEPATRQPVHGVYGGAHLFKANTVQRMGQLAPSAVREYAPAA